MRDTGIQRRLSFIFPAGALSQGEVHTHPPFGPSIDSAEERQD